MKKIFCFLIFAATVLSVGYAEDCRIECKDRDGSGNPLINLMLTRELPLTKQNIALGSSIHSHAIETNGHSHTAFYRDATIYTYLSEHDPLLGKQFVYFYVRVEGEEVAREETSESTTWEVKKIKGRKYIVHHHDGFYVCSTGDKQFVVSDL